MPNILRRDFSRGWFPSADAINADPRTLLRADNVTLDDEGIVSLRAGSAKINGSALADLDIHSLHTAIIAGTRSRITGAGNHVYSNSTDLGATFAGSGDIALNDGFGQVFMARSTTKKKWDGTTLTNWGMAQPISPPTVVAQEVIGKTLATCDQSESPAFTTTEGAITGTFPTGADGTANGSIEVTPSSTTGRGTITKTFTSDQNFFDVGGIPGDARDYFDLLAWVTEPEKLEKVTVMIGLGTGTDPFQDDYYWFDFNFGSVKPSVVDMKEPSVISAAAVQVANSRPVEQIVAENNGHTTTSASTSEVSADPTRSERGSISEIRAFIENSQSSQEDRRREVKFAATNPGWTHYSCLRGQFNRTGTTSGRNWTTVRSLKIIYKAVAGSTGVVRFDTIRIVGGAQAGALMGSFRFRWRAVKDYTSFVEMSPLSSQSFAVEFIGQRARVTIPYAAASVLDTQADTVWVYFFSSLLGAYYRCAVSRLIPGTSMSIDEFDIQYDGWDATTDLLRICGVGMTTPKTYTLTGDLNIDVTMNEIEALFVNEVYTDLETTPPDSIVGFVTDYFQRHFVIAQVSGADGYLYISERRKPGVYKFSRSIRIGNSTETLYWIKKTAGGLYIGTSREIYAVTGNADELEDGTLDLSIDPVNIDSPPVDSATGNEGNKIIYRALDGWRLFDGVSSVPVPRDAVELLHRGYTRHGVSPLNLTGGRFRAALSNNILTTLAPEGASTTSTSTLYRVKFAKGQWERATYPNAFTCIHREPDGTVIGGDSSGFVWTLDSGTADGATAISPVVWGISDNDTQPLQKKDLFDFSLEADTGNTAAAIALHLDGSASAASNGSFNATANGHAFYKRSIADVASCRNIQWRIGPSSLPAFKLYSVNTAYRARPQQRMYWDTGYINVGIEDVEWARFFRIMVNTPSDLTVTVYFDDTALAAKTLTAVANKATIYEIPLGREYKGGQPRIVVSSAASPGTTEPLGFEAYWSEVAYRPSGNESERKFKRIQVEG